MAQSGNTINILANVRGAVQGVADVAEAVEEAADVLHDLTKEGDKASDRMEADFRDIAKAADRSSDQLRDKFRQAYKDIRSDSDKTADEVVRGQSKIAERSGEVGQEVRQNLGEGIANAARGDFAALSDTIGDTFGGAVAGIGGVGAAAVAAAGALGVGALVAAFTVAEEKRKILEQRANDLARAYIEAGTEAVDAMTLASNIADILTDPERKKKAQELGEALGGDVSTGARILAGDTEALAEAQALANAAAERNIEIGETMLRGSSKRKSAQAEEFDRNQKLIEAVAAEVEVRNIATETYNAYERAASDALTAAINNTKGVTKEVDELGNELYSLPSGEQILISAETGQATTNIEAFKGDVDGIPEQVTTKVGVTGAYSASDFKRRLVRDLSGAVVQVEIQGKYGKQLIR